MDVLSPCGAQSRRFKSLAPRPGGLAGRAVGILDNSKPNAGVLLAGVAELLAARAGAGPLRTWRKPASAQPAECLDEIARSVEVVLTGSAD
ncbi:MAG: hypothetical protein HYY64_00635 [Candidatus Rokubacteria bacterium]|nr:hypothetical protein [Candidatus Rokubacteria bacterium]